MLLIILTVVSSIARNAYYTSLTVKIYFHKSDPNEESWSLLDKK